MSAPTGITVSPELTQAFSHAVDSQAVRFLKISIRNESLVLDDSIPPSGTLEQDFDKLGSLLEDNVPAYILVRMDEPPSQFLPVFYVPDTAKVRDKMLYAATRNNLTKALGSTHFNDSLFATSKDDVTLSAYKRHKAHLAAPQPMSAREKEVAEIKAAERAAGGAGYEANREKRSHLGDRVGFQWSEETDEAVRSLEGSDDSRLIVLTVDAPSETIHVLSNAECTVDQLASSIPPDQPSYGFFAWPRSNQRDIVYIYSCPSSSPVKHRMLYSSGARAMFHTAKNLLGVASLLERKIETSDPTELTEDYLKLELGLTDDQSSGAGTTQPVQAEDKKAFARPKGPGRRR
ncbi:hypothetical protein QCA50_003265 [Cerrena zonata]|uniref:ADF-H domain-containing protein n=1 Tax=Cerrena zonata TaxID=2478898 RepID=A0AAW0GRL8_9APHY